MEIFMFCLSIVRDTAKAKKKGESYVIYLLDNDDIEKATKVCKMLESSNIKAEITDGILKVYC